MTTLLLGGQIDIVWAVLLYLAWNVQMGLHEGGHAIIADRLGDPIPRAFGKVTINPYKHIEWDNSSYVISAVVLPAATALTMGVPLGMAWVMISGNHSTKNHAKIAIAGPVGSFLAGLIGIVLFFLLYPLIYMGTDSQSVFQIQTFAAQCCLALVVTSAFYGAFNLVPIPPLDGSNVLYHFMNREGRDFMDKIRPYGFFIIIALFWIGNGGKYVVTPVIQASADLMNWLPQQVWG